MSGVRSIPCLASTRMLLAVFNMIPLPPLDGSAVLSGLVPESVARGFDMLHNYSLILLIGVIYLGVPSYLFIPVIRFVDSFLVF